MSRHLLIAFIVMLGVRQAARAIEIPLHPSEAKMVEQIIAVEGHAAEVAEVPGWAKASVISRLKELGVETAGLRFWGVRDTKRNAVSFGCTCDSNGRALALSGNGPWSHDESLQALKRMPELRIIRRSQRLSAEPAEVRDLRRCRIRCLGGFEAHENAVDPGINDAGMEQAARINGLKSFEAQH